METIKQAGGPVDPIQNIQGVLDFTNFEKVFKVVVLLTNRFLRESTIKSRLERRVLLKADK